MMKALTLGAILLIATACGSTTAATPPTAAATGHTTTATATMSMSPTEMAAMGHSATPATTTTASSAAPAATQPAPQIAPAATSSGAPVPAAPTTAPTEAPITTAAPTAAPTAATQPTAAPAGPAATVSVTLQDMAIKLSTLSVPTGTVTFVATNAGTTPHEFVVLKTSFAQNALPADPANPATVTEPGFLGKIPSLLPKASGSITLALGPGSYVLICNEPAHYSALGMHIGFSVR